MMQHEAIRIDGDFDVAIARNLLRRKAAEQNWRPIFRARAAAALTAMANLMLCEKTEGALDIALVERGERSGVELQGLFCWPDNRYIWLDEMRNRLAPVVDEMEIRDTPTGPCITVWIWLPLGKC